MKMRIPLPKQVSQAFKSKVDYDRRAGKAVVVDAEEDLGCDTCFFDPDTCRKCPKCGEPLQCEDSQNTACKFDN